MAPSQPVVKLCYKDDVCSITAVQPKQPEPVTWHNGIDLHASLCSTVVSAPVILLLGAHNSSSCCHDTLFEVMFQEGSMCCNAALYSTEF